MSDSNDWSAPDQESQRPQDPLPQYPMAPPPPQQYYGPRYVPKPGVIPLRPLGLGEILDGAVTTIRTYPKQMLGVSALVETVSALLSLGVLLYVRFQTDLLVVRLPADQYDVQANLDAAFDAFRATLVVAIPALVIAVLARAFLTGFLTVVVGKAVLGQSVSFSETWQHVKPRVGALLGASVLYTLMVVGASFGFLVPGIWLYVLFSLTSTALILEGAKVGGAFGRSRDLVSGAWWRTCGILLLATILAAILSYIIELPVNLLSGGLYNLTGTGPVPDLGLAILLNAVAGILAGTLTQPFVSGVTTLVYIDRRMRREGMDIELTRQAGITPPGPAQPA
ncbi:hypothetical protein [Actinocrispum wychmicini]|uniref:DUF7847 domain-containing protein n=1 Tax=Actinocrispum wychmicini TaxID=1213861 RepID=A0A4R2JTJ3_9PSEU|nr:hypothetical protein [Actinocrispum wychmicini]TCO62457.1 hypothetical protein EV192_102595 [Actinocrispum wychmicini]